MAVCIGLVAILFAFRKKYILSIGFILLASTFHYSSLILIPLVFIMLGDAWNKRTLLFILAVMVILFFVSEFTDLLDSSLTETEYKNVVYDIRYYGDNGTHPLRVLLYSVPTIIALVGRKKIADSNNAFINLCTNASIISTGLYIVSIFTSGIFMGRMPIYVSLFNYILLPWEVENIIPKKYRTIFLIVLIAVYLVFYYYQTSIKWRLF